MNPGGSGQKLAAVEISRYQWAAKLCEHKNVLDYGCGHGQGSAILREKALGVTGYDIDVEALEYARTHYPRIRFVGSFFDEPKWYETIVCLEVIEHIEDGQGFLEQLKKLLKPHGQLLLSTPNRFHTEKHGLKNPYHLHEYYPEEIQMLLVRSGFSVVEYSQPYDENKTLERLSPIAPLFIKKAWRGLHRVPVNKSRDPESAVQLYQCFLKE